MSKPTPDESLDDLPLTSGGGPAPGSAAPRDNTVRWVSLVPVADPATVPAPTQAPPPRSTPAPHAHDRGTIVESADQLAQQWAAERGAQLVAEFPPIPGYEILRFVARGGMGVVYEAVQLSTGRRVALKLVNPVCAQDPVTRERFAREIRSLAALKHPNIVPVYDAGDWHGFPYLAMEFVSGGTLSHHIDRVRADLRGAVLLMAKAARAVAAMHAVGILHRDLKPLNILLGENDEPMVADFGLARFDGESDLTGTGEPVGTRQYMAPEQTLGRRTEYSPACDVWALGVTLYEVLSGTRPFSDDGYTDIYARIRVEEPPPLASLAAGVPAELEAVVLKCLSKRPEGRYASAAALADDLEKWLTGLPLLARPIPAPLAVPQPKPRRRVRALVAAAAVGVLAVVLAGGSGAFRPAPVPPAKTLAQRVAAGERVKLTDDKGEPTVPWTNTEGREIAEKPLYRYHGFTSTDVGLANLANEAWGCPIRVEADVTVNFDTDARTAAGVYVGRRTWDGLEFSHESLVWFGVSPRHDAVGQSQRQLAGRAAVYWWDRDRLASSGNIDEVRTPWDRPADAGRPRFARVAIDIRGDDISGTVDGLALKTVTESGARSELARILARNKQFPQYTFTPSSFGTGIGVFCQHADCAILNLTVSKLDP